jgi:Dolichyl-phosphate-mannose-protein mannosyltransferase/Alg9-like mannosyltransferase family
VLAVQFAMAIYWLEKNPLLYGSIFLVESLEITDKVIEQGPAGFIEFAAGQTYYPPLYQMAGAVLHLIFGFSRTNMALLNFLFLALAAFSIYGLCTRYWSPTTGLGAALCFLLIPEVFMYARIPLRELPLAALAVGLVYAMVRSEGFTRIWPAVAFAAIFSAGMMIKWTYVGFMIFPIAYYFLGEFIAGTRSGARTGLQPVAWRNVGISAGLIFVMLAPWYLGALDWEYLGRTVENDPVPVKGIVGALAFYIRELNHYGLSKFFAPIALGLAALSIFGKQRGKLLLIFVWLIAGYVIFTRMPHKESRYILPLIPALVILALGGVEALRKSWLKNGLIALLVVAGSIQFVQASFVRNVFPSDSGYLIVQEQQRCPEATRDSFDQFLTILKNNERTRDRLELFLATHPFNEVSNYFDEDQIALWSRLRSRKLNRNPEWSRKRTVAKEGPKVIYMGMPWTHYHAFYEMLDRMDLLFVDQDLFDSESRLIQEGLGKWKQYEVPEFKENQPKPPESDPGLLKLIDTHFEQIGMIEGDCIKSVLVMLRRESPDSTPADSTQ